MPSPTTWYRPVDPDFSPPVSAGAGLYQDDDAEWRDTLLNEYKMRGKSLTQKGEGKRKNKGGKKKR